LRRTGDRLRNVLDQCRNEQVLDAFEADVQSGIDETSVKEVRRRLCEEFGAVLRPERFSRKFVGSSDLKGAHDCHAEVLSGWMREGFPLGISREITATGVFPQTGKDTAAVEASSVIMSMKTCRTITM
jgi:hypothetical protein